MHTNTDALMRSTFFPGSFTGGILDFAAQDFYATAISFDGAPLRSSGTHANESNDITDSLFGVRTGRPVASIAL